MSAGNGSLVLTPRNATSSTITAFRLFIKKGKGIFSFLLCISFLSCISLLSCSFHFTGTSCSDLAGPYSVCHLSVHSRHFKKFFKYSVVVKACTNLGQGDHAFRFYQLLEMLGNLTLFFADQRSYTHRFFTLRGCLDLFNFVHGGILLLLGGHEGWVWHSAPL